MKLEFKDIFNRHKGVKCWVVAHGPSANPYLDKLEELRKDCIVIGCNEWYGFYDKAPDYWVIASNMTTVVSEKDKINQSKTTLVYSDSVDYTDRVWVESNIKRDYLPYDQRHFDSKPCGCESCCKQIIPGRLTIQEELKKHTGFEKRYGTGDSIAIHMLSLGVLLGCNPIYYVGVDLDYRKGYARNNLNLVVPRTNEWDGMMDRLNSDISIIKESAKKIGIVVEKQP